jgi:4-hydroxy-3-methylbut-2-enyl diphosphate reductase
MGVQRAVELAVSQAAGTGKVYTLGPLIHNPNVLADLKRRGVEILKEPPQNSKGCSLIIRAHGISVKAEKGLRDRGFHIIDATCPKVKESQLKAEELARAGYCLFLAGEAEPPESVLHEGSPSVHAEIAGILGYAENGFGEKESSFCAVVGSAADAEKEAAKLFEKNSRAKTALLGQTTFSQEEYSSIGKAIGQLFPNLEIIQTICAATASRQQALRELLDECEAVLIVGGKDSANTRRLLAIAQESGKPCALVEKPSDIPADFINYETIGICAGASTPDSAINEIELELFR